MESGYANPQQYSGMFGTDGFLSGSITSVRRQHRLAQIRAMADVRLQGMDKHRRRVATAPSPAFEPAIKAFEPQPYTKSYLDPEFIHECQPRRREFSTFAMSEEFPARPHTRAYPTHLLNSRPLLQGGSVSFHSRSPFFDGDLEPFTRLQTQRIWRPSTTGVKSRRPKEPSAAAKRKGAVPNPLMPPADNTTKRRASNMVPQPPRRKDKNGRVNFATTSHSETFDTYFPCKS